MVFSRTAGILYLIGMLAVASPAFAGEYAVLHTGFRLRVDRHEIDGARVRLFSDGGLTEMPVSAVERFEAEETVSAPSPAVQAAAPATPVPATAPAPVELAGIAANKFALPASFVRSVMRAESGFQPGAVSPRGAIGLMQLMPETAKALGVDPRDPKQNAEGGAQYLRDLLLQYQDDPDQVLLALAAYNAGPDAVKRYHGVPPYAETRSYILRVLKNWDQQEKP